MNTLESHRTDTGILTLTLNRPERKNALDQTMADALVAALDAAETDRGVRCVVLTGAGDAFCSGGDLSPGGGNEPPPHARTIMRERYPRHSADTRRAISKALISRWTPETFADDPRPGLVFLVGFPRSGTTLTEQVLAAHPNIVTSNERPFVPHLLESLAVEAQDRDVASRLPDLDEADTRRLRARYWDQVHGAEPGHEARRSGRKAPLCVPW